jgi:segregation and condensation protein A
MVEKTTIEKENTTQEKPAKPSVRQEQIHDLLFNRELGWQEIIYDLINTEQLDPWDIDIIILSDRYLEKIREIEEADFFISSKVLLAASLLLRIKSEILLNKYIQSIDDILFGRKEQPKYTLERIELDENIPELIPKSPLPRFRKVTLKELMDSLNKAIITENRRIKREIVTKDSVRESAFSLPKKKFSIKNKIIEVYRNLTDKFKQDREKNRISYNEFVNNSKEEKILSFLPLLYLEEQKKVWLEQEKPFEEIYIWLKDVFLRHNPEPYADLKQEAQKSEEKKPKRKKNPR